jgi:translation initiation factor 4G
MTDDHKKDPKPADPKSVVAQQPPNQRHPQQDVKTDPEHTGSINEPPGSDTTPWYNPSQRDADLHKQEQKRNYTPEQQQQRQEETAKAGKADHEESEARKRKQDEEDAKKRKQDEEEAKKRK